MSSGRRNSRSAIASPQTIEENSELDLTGYRLRNPSYKHSLEANVEINDTQLRTALKPVDDSEDESDDTAQELEKDSSSSQKVVRDNMPLQPQSTLCDSHQPLLLRKEDWSGKNNTHKLDMVFESINKLYAVYDQVAKKIQPLNVAVFDTDDGILPQLQNLADYAKGADSRVDHLMKENNSLREELEVVKGILHKQAKQISTLQSRQVQQTARSMAENITISGIIGDSEQADASDAKLLAKAFLAEELEIEDEEQNGILVAHWLGQYTKDKHRSIIIKVKPNLKTKILDNTHKLATKKNPQDRPYSVNVQLPEMLAEQKREIRQIIKEKKDSERDLDDTRKSKILVRNNKVYINGQLQRKLLQPPSIPQLFDISRG